MDDLSTSVGETAERTVSRARELAEDTVEQTKKVGRDIGKRGRAAAADGAHELGRLAREQASTARDAVYQQGARAGEYLTQRLNDYPFAALIAAGAIGFGIAYLLGAGRSSD